MYAVCRIGQNRDKTPEILYATGLLALGLAGLILLAPISGCERAPAGAMALPPTEVTVAQPVAREVRDSVEFTGTTAALETVDIRARVTGFLEKVHFEPRAKVSQGDLLFTIDPRPFRNTLDQAEATRASFEAQLVKAQSDLDKIQRLVPQGAASQDELTTHLTERDQLAAQVAEATAHISNAQLNLDFCSVTAPISGRVSRTQLDPGNLVAADNVVLATMINDEDVYAYFNASERDALVLQEQTQKRLEAQGKSLQARPELSEVHPPAFLGLMTEAGFPHAGYIDYAGLAVDPSTGTIQLRARFPNADGALMAGLFVRILVPVGMPQSALLVTERALGSDQGQRYLLVVNPQNVVEYRPVQVGSQHEGLRVITAGLRLDDWVIVNGLQRVRPGVTVKPVQVQMPVLAGARPADSGMVRTADPTTAEPASSRPAREEQQP